MKFHVIRTLNHSNYRLTALNCNNNMMMDSPKMGHGYENLFICGTKNEIHKRNIEKLSQKHQFRIKPSKKQEIISWYFGN